MTDEAAHIEEATPIKKTARAYIFQILGGVDVPGSEIKGAGAGNSTRWVFDLEVEAGVSLDIFLLDPRTRSRRITPDLMSYSLTACSPSFYDARPIAFHDPKKGSLTLSSTKTREGVFACRVAIDIMHSATR